MMLRKAKLWSSWYKVLVARNFTAQDLGEDVVGIVGGASHPLGVFPRRSRALLPRPLWRSSRSVGVWRDLAERAGVGQFAHRFGNIGALVLEIVVQHRAAQTPGRRYECAE